MPQTIAKRTTMYSVDELGRVVVHYFPFDANDKWGMKKAERFIERGFTFNDPRLGKVSPVADVQVVEVVDMDRPVGVVDTPPQDEDMAVPVAEGVEDVAVGIVELAAPQGSAGIVCPECGKICKNTFGLKSHSKSHKK